jgi:hypothetical protein
MKTFGDLAIGDTFKRDVYVWTKIASHRADCRYEGVIVQENVFWNSKDPIE